MGDLRSQLPVPIKKLVWNLKHGVLGYPKFVAPSDVIEYLSPRLDERASVLDLGAGRGSLLRGLRERGWTGPFCGVEISRRALRDARNFADQRSTWIVSDIEGFRSPLRWDAITFVESVYYIALPRLPEVLSRFVGMLEESGFVLIRLHELDKYREYIETTQELYPHLEKIGANLFRISNFEEEHS